MVRFMFWFSRALGRLDCNVKNWLRAWYLNLSPSLSNVKCYLFDYHRSLLFIIEFQLIVAWFIILYTRFWIRDSRVREKDLNFEHAYYKIIKQMIERTETRPKYPFWMIGLRMWVDQKLRGTPMSERVY